jgi:hypothetical protein
MTTQQPNTRTKSEKDQRAYARMKSEHAEVEHAHMHMRHAQSNQHAIQLIAVQQAPPWERRMMRAQKLS